MEERCGALHEVTLSLGEFINLNIFKFCDNFLLRLLDDELYFYLYVGGRFGKSVDLIGIV